MNASIIKKPQIEKFRDKARELEADESVEKFDAARGFGKRRKRSDD